MYRIEKMPRKKARVVHINRLATHAGDDNEDRVAHMKTVPSFDEFMTSYSTAYKAHFGVTRELHRDLFSIEPDYTVG